MTEWARITYGSWRRKRSELFRWDCLDVLRAIEDCTLDSLVTDPPAGIAFMGKDWDKDKGGRAGWVAWMTDVMRECLRVLKPGAHGLVWAIPRTSHWTATALEDAGFEVRDVITHLFGTGFPKSLDVSKAIDKAAGCIRPRVRGGQGGKNSVLGARKPGEAISGEAISGEAISWQGWGTALKPASEHWILVRKPCSEKTVAANVLKWGTGAINVDGCRISTDGRPGAGSDSMFKNKGGREGTPLGRFPANLVLDEQAAAMLDEQSGTSSGSGKRVAKTQNSMGFHGGDKAYDDFSYPDSGGASRFFYVAKASKQDRGADNKHPTVKSTKLMAYLCRLVTPPGGTVLDPFAGSGSTGVAALAEGFRFVGIEAERAYYKTAIKRLREIG